MFSKQREFIYYYITLSKYYTLQGQKKNFEISTEDVEKKKTEKTDPGRPNSEVWWFGRILPSLLRSSEKPTLLSYDSKMHIFTL